LGGLLRFWEKIKGKAKPNRIFGKSAAQVFSVTQECATEKRKEKGWAFAFFSQKSKEKALSRLKPPLLDAAPVFSLTCGTRFTGPTWQQEGSFFRLTRRISCSSWLGRVNAVTYIWQMGVKENESLRWPTSSATAMACMLLCVLPLADGTD
jgi:hypothetical protein